MKSIKISTYLQIINPTYVYLKLTPDTSIRNYDSSNIAKSISKMYKTTIQQISRQEKYLHWYNFRFQIETPVKCSYLIDIYKNDVSFYFIVPSQHKSIIMEKIQATWKKVAIEEVSNIKEFSQEVLKYQMNYKKEDAFSLAIDKRNNEPLNTIFNVIDILEDEDRIGIFYNFLPCHQLPFRKEYRDTMLKVKDGKPIDREKINGKYMFKLGMTYVIDFLDSIVEVLNDFTGGVVNKKNESLSILEIASEVLNNPRVVSKATNKKKDAIIINTQMLILSESGDKLRKGNNALAVCQSYKSIEEEKEEGNELVYKKVRNNKKNIFNINDLHIAGVETNRVSVEECQNFIQLPAKDLLSQYNRIKKIDTLETLVPDVLQKGVMCVGSVAYKSNSVMAYLSDDSEFKNLTLCIIAPTRAGKTTLIGNLSKDGIDNNETVINFDFCGNCELSNDIEKVIPKNKTLNIDCSNIDTLQGLGYNEIIPLTDTVFENYRCAKTKTSQLMTLINTLSDDEELKARMERYLESASIIVFIQNGSIKDVFKLLQDHNVRKQFINNAPENQSENLEEYILSLKELDEWSKATKDNPSIVIGTKLSFIQGILNRVSKLKQNTYMELMLKKDCSNNINLIEEMQKAQLINIRMPEVMFSTEQEKDVYCTYWLTKIWSSLQVRKWNIPNAENRIKVNLLFDELYQVNNCQYFLKSKLSQIAKFSAKSIISCHYLGQIGIIRNELKASNASYMIISGADKDNFNEMKQELAPYELDDLLNLKRYESLNLIRYSNGWARFISKLPKPL